jgi:alkanesulfonate monooxygenase SsuD/methylene tetrahydromethanopterin reductase-like flavin-dependent oxidoreductase (luciferase family)
MSSTFKKSSRPRSWVTSQYFIIEHQNSDVGQITAPSVYLGAVAQRTSRIRFGTMIYQLPFYNPIRIAEEAAIVDHISEDRLVFGVGRSSFLESYQGYNIDYGESRGRFAESLEIILKAWGDEPLSYEGEFYQFHDVNLVPKPYQKPHPPVRVAVESVDTFALTGSLGFPYSCATRCRFPSFRSSCSSTGMPGAWRGSPAPTT